MTPSELSAIRARLDAAPNVTWNGSLMRFLCNDLRALLNEVERLKNDLAMARQVSGELCDSCGWAMKFPGEPCRCELLAKVERLTAEVDVLRGTFCEEECEVDGETMTRDRCGVCRKCAYRRGAEAMREVAAQRCEISPIHGQKTTTAQRYADAVRAVPTPEDK